MPNRWRRHLVRRTWLGPRATSALKGMDVAWLALIVLEGISGGLSRGSSARSINAGHLDAPDSLARPTLRRGSQIASIRKVVLLNQRSEMSIG